MGMNWTGPEASLKVTMGFAETLCLADCGEENRIKMKRVQGECSKEGRADVRPEMAQR